MGRVEQHVAADGVHLLAMRGDGRNPLDLELVQELADALERLDRSTDCRAVVIASDDRHFCAGATSKFAPGARQWSTGDLYDNVPRLLGVDIPVVVALNGAAIGGGLGLALAGDWLQMASDARAQANFTRLGFTPGFGLTVLLPDRVGDHRATELLMSGRPVDAPEALAMGLADAVSDPDSLRADAIARAVEFATAAPLAIRAVKAARREQTRRMLPDTLSRELALQEQLKSTEDYREGIAAMTERRPPRFRGR